MQLLVCCMDLGVDMPWLLLEFCVEVTADAYMLPPYPRHPNARACSFPLYDSSTSPMLRYLT